MSKPSRKRRSIERAAETHGLTIESIDWAPWRNGGEMEGLNGGWTVKFTDGRHALGLTANETVEWIERMGPTGDKP